MVAWSDQAKQQFGSLVMVMVMVTSVFGNFLAAAIAKMIRYRGAIVWMLVAYFLVMITAYGTVRSSRGLLPWLGLIGVCQGVFGLFTMYLPPLFPTLLRTTGAGFCYNIGRLASAVSVVAFGVFSVGGNHQMVLFYAAFLFPLAAAVALLLPDPPDGHG